MATIYDAAQNDIWDNTTGWNDEEALSEEDVIIDNPYSVNIDDEEDDDMDNEWFKTLMTEDEEEPEVYSSMKDDPYYSSWIPPKKTPKVNVTDNAKYAFNYLTEKGLPAHVSAGIVGNLMKESGVNPNSRDGDRRGGIGGIAQWDPTRSRNLLRYADAKGIDPSSLDLQLDFVIQEASQRGDLEEVMNARTPEEAAMIFGRRYERPNEKYADWETRRANAASLLTRKRFGGIIKAQGGGVNNIPEDNLLLGVSTDSIQQYLDQEGLTPEQLPIQQVEIQESKGDKIATIANNITQGVNRFKQLKDKLNSIGAGAAQSVSDAIDIQSEIAGFQRNAVSLRKFNEQKNKKRYSSVQPILNQPLTYT